MVDPIRPNEQAPRETPDRYALVHFSRDPHTATSWDVAVYRTKNSTLIDVLETTTLDCKKPFFANQLWCDTGPGQDFLWKDYPLVFQELLRKYSENRPE